MDIDSFSSVAIFGSVARGDNDILSDRDLLVISENRAQSQSISVLRSQGFSPAAYTWHSFDLLARHRSLFLFHLKFESKIIKDDNDRLTKFLSSIEAPQNYSSTLSQSVALAELTSYVPNDEQLKLWAADVLAVAVRNYLVAFVARQGKYVFAYSSLIDIANESFNLAPDEKQALLELRSWKALYRNKGQAARPPLGINRIQLAQQAIASMTGARFADAQMAPHEFAHHLLNHSATSESWYHAVRRYEGAYRSIHAKYFGYDLVREIEGLIASPTCYMNDGRVLWTELRRHVHRAFAKATN